MTGTPPPYLEAVPERARVYPPAWRDAAVRALYCLTSGGITCPGCQRLFATRAQLRELQADHILAYSRGGETTWINLQLLCGRCNLLKSDRPHHPLVFDLAQKAALR
jgi:5-methylcytosine-specific restriction endonuclease McrA